MKRLEDLSDKDLAKRLREVEEAIPKAKAGADQLGEEMRQAGARHSAAERAVGVLRGRLEMGREAVVIGLQDRAEEADRRTAREVAELEIRRVDAEFAHRQAILAASRARDHLRNLRRVRHELLHAWGGRDWRLGRA